MESLAEKWLEIAIGRQRAALLPIVNLLFAMAGLDEGGAQTLPWRIYRRIRMLLRPAESALRRLIVATAHSIDVTVRAPRPTPRRYVPWWAVRTPAPAAPSDTGGPGLPDTERQTPPALVVAAPSAPRPGKPKQIPAQEFCRRFGLAWAGPLPEAATDEHGEGLGRIPAFQLFDPFKHFDLYSPASREAGSPELFAGGMAGDEVIGSVALCRRVAALKSAYDDMDGQAIRLARWQARRRYALARGGTVRPWRQSPIRLGWPPGWRKRPVHDIDDILRECDIIARNLPPRAIDSS